ncbi:MAG: hypothetical protein R6X20_02280 [Phycisphaerae bacterium]
MIRLIVPLAGLALVGAGLAWLWHPGAGLAAAGLGLWLDAAMTEILDLWRREGR